MRSSAVKRRHRGGRRKAAARGSNVAVRRVDQNVEFATVDEQKRTIPWVRITIKDGKSTVYFDAESKVAPAEMDQKPKRKMECADCHNAPGHPFTNPADRVDQALAEGPISTSIPSIKARALAIIDKASALHCPIGEQMPGTRTPRAASAATMASTSTIRARRSGSNAGFAMIFRRSPSTAR
jgi:hypothetical protein